MGCVATVTQRALEDSNPRHRVLETRVLPTELRTHETRCHSSTTAQLYLILVDWAIKTLLQTGSFAHAIAQVVELGPTSLTPT